MNFFWKLYFSIMLIVTVCFGIGGYVLIQSSFHTSLDREIEVSFQENDILYISFERILSTIYGIDSATILEKDMLASDEAGTLADELSYILQNVAKSISIQNANGNIPFRLSDQNGKIVFQDIHFAVQESLAPSLTAADRGHRIVEIEGRYYIQTAQPLTLAGTVFYIENYRDITPVFQHKQGQYRTFIMLILVLFGGCALVIFFLARWLMRPIRALSRATKQLATGHFKNPVRVANNDEIGTLASDFNAMSLKLLQTMDNLKETATRQEMFAGNFAHEMKTPLTSMIGYADMLRSKKLTEEQQILFANQIVQDGKRLEALSMKLMDLIVLKREDLPMRRVSSKQFFQSIYQTVLPVMEQNHIRFTVKCQYALLTIEPDLMATVCINLLDNARKAIDEGQKGEISLLGRRCDDGYEILVIDNGCGMEQEELAKITEAFYMVDKSRSRKKGGAGLGLAVCSEILRLHGGLLEFVSQPGQGTCARVWLRGEYLHAEA